MNLYEMMFIINPEIGEEDREKLLTRIKATIEKYGGEIIKTEDMGLKTMSYKIMNKSRGHYMLSYLEGPGTMVSEIERILRIDENILRFVVIKLDKKTSRQDLEPKEEPVAETPKETAEPAAEPVKEEVAE